MASSDKVYKTLITFTCILAALSAFGEISGWDYGFFKRINLLSSILQLSPKDSLNVKHNASKYSERYSSVSHPAARPFSDYSKGSLVMNFQNDTLDPALKRLMSKLYLLKHGQKLKVRIAYLGDSMIEADLISGTLRKLMQHEFGGSGAGYLPFIAVAASTRTTVSQKSQGFVEKNFKTTHGKVKQLYLSGRTFFTGNGHVEINDHTFKPQQIIEKFLLCGRGDAVIEAGQIGQQLHAPWVFNKIQLAGGGNGNINIDFKSAGSLPLYGLDIESPYGVSVDNYSFRGISGSELLNIDAELLKMMNNINFYDLIILQYGVNELFGPDLKHFSWYARILIPAINHLKTCFPKSDFLIISAGDRAFRYSGEYQTAIGLDSLIKTQAQVAQLTGCSFYNLFKSMGGKGTMVKWVNASPAMAYADYVHPNISGAAFLGENLYKAFIADYKKFKVHSPNL